MARSEAGLSHGDAAGMNTTATVKESDAETSADAAAAAAVSGMHKHTSVISPVNINHRCLVHMQFYCCIAHSCYLHTCETVRSEISDNLKHVLNHKVV